MGKLKEFTVMTARPLPVILLADVSGSMSVDGKIEALNGAVQEMMKTFVKEEEGRAEIHMSIITFGGEVAVVHQPLLPIAKALWKLMDASGRTPMGHAFQLAKIMIEDKNQIPSRAYRPTVILVSDGQPTDEWQQSLNDLLQSERASKAMRFAMGIGEDADHSMLRFFLGNENEHVFQAHEARDIQKFFRWVTMSVTTRSRSINPNDTPELEPTDLDDLVF